MQTTPTVAEARAVGIVGNAWPYGPNIDHRSRRELVAWATAHRLRYSPRGQCLHWITTGRCAVQICDSRPHSRQWMDHVTGWTRGGKPAVLIAQPYGITGDSFAQLAELDRSGLRVTASGTGWYGHDTTFITVWRTDQDPTDTPNAP